MIENNKQYETTKSYLLRFKKELVLVLKAGYKTQPLHGLLKSLIIELMFEIIDYDNKKKERFHIDHDQVRKLRSTI
jgi:hypothetical protein